MATANFATIIFNRAMIALQFAPVMTKLPTAGMVTPVFAQLAPVFAQLSPIFAAFASASSRTHAVGKRRSSKSSNQEAHYQCNL